MQKCGLYNDGETARLAVLNNEVDIAVFESIKPGVTFLKIRGLPNEIVVPEKLAKLPGFEFVGVGGIPAPPVTTYVCYRTSAEVISALEDA